MRRLQAAALLVPTLMCLAVPAVQAAGFGRLTSSTVLGGPLDVTAPITLEPGESVQADCVSAEVLSGDDPLTSQVIRASIVRSASGPRLRVQTTIRIEEPVVTVLLSIDCGAGISRQFTVLVDPPDYTPAPSLAAVSPDVRDDGSSAIGTAQGSTSASSETRPRPAPRTRRPPVSPAPSRPAIAAATPAPDAAASTAIPNVARPAVTPASAPVVARARQRASAPTGSRLVLDSDPGRSAPVARVSPIASAAAASPDAEAQADAEALAALRAQEAQIKVLEATLERLRAAEAAQIAAQASAQASAQTSAAAVPARAPAAAVPTAPKITAILWGLAGLLLVLLTAAGLRWWHQARLRKRMAWWAAEASLSAATAAEAAAAEAATAPDVMPVAAIALPLYVDAPAPVAVAAPTPRPAPPWRDPVVPHAPTIGQGSNPPVAPSPPEPITHADVPSSARDLTVEDLLDLEQQADFFIVLGQDDAAVDLLMSMVRSSGGSSPLPYIKLLEIYRRGDDRGPYDRIRERFNQRFNGAAPAWEDDLALGRDLEQYPGVLAGLEDAWLSPVDACQALEQLLFRRDDPDMPQFDLPAFAELLFLHRLALDLVEHQRASDGVDLLIPF